MWKPRSQKHNPLLVLLISVGMSLSFALLCVMVIAWRIGPRTNFGFGIAYLFPSAATIAAAFGVVTSPLLYYGLDNRPLGKSLVILSSIVSAEIVVIGAIDAHSSFIGFLIAYPFGLLIARHLTAP